jgi:hypothetical protein
MLTTVIFLLATAWASAEPTYDPAWSQVLERFVDERGRVDFAGLRRDAKDLSAQVEFVARKRPEDFKEGAPRLAFLINAYNSLAMSHAAHSGLKPESKIRFFFLSKHVLGGRKLSLHALENDIIRPLGEARVHFALNCMVRGCPRLPREPFSPDKLQAQLNAAAQEFLNESRNVVIDPTGKTVQLSSILKWYREDFLTVAPSLAAYVNRYRQAKIPEGAEIDFLSYDWTLNSQD